MSAYTFTNGSDSPAVEGSDCDAGGRCSECIRWQCGMPTSNGKCTNSTLREGDDFCQKHEDTDFRLADYDSDYGEFMHAEYFCGSDRKCCDSYLGTSDARYIRCYRHNGGVDIGLGHLYWLYMVCPACERQHAWSKM